MKTGLEKMITYLEKMYIYGKAQDNPDPSGVVDGIKMQLDYARSLLAEEIKDCPCADYKEIRNNLIQSQKPVADKGLIEDLNDLITPENLPLTVEVLSAKIKIAISRYTPEESLAELLIKSVGGNAGFHVHQWEDKTWEIECAAHIFKGLTYLEAESKAREYLNGLPDAK